MKTRVLKYGTYYFPQYKGWFFWHYFFKQDESVFFVNKESAIKFLLNEEGEKFKEVVWESKK
jgi:hypothetical protein